MNDDRPEQILPMLKGTEWTMLISASEIVNSTIDPARTKLISKTTFPFPPGEHFVNLGQAVLWEEGNRSILYGKVVNMLPLVEAFGLVITNIEAVNRHMNESIEMIEKFKLEMLKHEKRQEHP